MSLSDTVEGLPWQWRIFRVCDRQELDEPTGSIVFARRIQGYQSPIEAWSQAEFGDTECVLCKDLVQIFHSSGRPSQLKHIQTKSLHLERFSDKFKTGFFMRLKTSKDEEEYPFPYPYRHNRSKVGLVWDYYLEMLYS